VRNETNTTREDCGWVVDSPSPVGIVGDICSPMVHRGARLLLGYCEGVRAMSKLPERINAMKSVTYDVESIVDAMMTMDYRETQEEITLEDILEWIGDDVEADINFSNVFYQDENGGEL